jgi:hypothetical protein
MFNVLQDNGRKKKQLNLTNIAQLISKCIQYM